MISVHARASDIPLTEDEIIRATQILAVGPVCVSTLQRRLQIGWARAADLIEHILGYDALPDVAKHR